MYSEIRRVFFQFIKSGILTWRRAARLHVEGELTSDGIRLVLLDLAFFTARLQYLFLDLFRRWHLV